MSGPAPLDRSWIVASSLQAQGADSRIKNATPSECVAMVWPLTLDAWSFKDASACESRLQRHVVRVIRRGS